MKKSSEKHQQHQTANGNAMRYQQTNKQIKTNETKKLTKLKRNCIYANWDVAYNFAQWRIKIAQPIIKDSGTTDSQTQFVWCTLYALSVPKRISRELNGSDWIRLDQRVFFLLHSFTHSRPFLLTAWIAKPMILFSFTFRSHIVEISWLQIGHVMIISIQLGISQLHFHAHFSHIPPTSSILFAQIINNLFFFNFFLLIYQVFECNQRSYSKAMRKHHFHSKYNSICCCDSYREKSLISHIVNYVSWIVFDCFELWAVKRMNGQSKVFITPNLFACICWMIQCNCCLLSISNTKICIA